MNRSKTKYLAIFSLQIDFEYESFEYEFRTKEDWEYFKSVMNRIASVFYKKDGMVLYFKDLLSDSEVSGWLKEIFYRKSYLLVDYGYYDGIMNVVFEERTSRKITLL